MNEYDKRFIARINFLANENCMLEAEKLFEEYIKENPNNIEMLLRFAKLELVPPLADEDKSIELIKKILNLDENNVEALILWAYIEFYDCGGVSRQVFNKLEKIKTNNSEKLAMIELMKASYYESLKDYINFEKSLKKSIQFCPNFVDHYLKLGKFYLEQNQLILAKEFLLNALNNIKKVYSENDPYDCTDYNEYFNELIKRIHVPEWQVNDLKKLIEKIEHN